jgi:hypothetical protein
MEVSIFLGIISREYALLYCWILTKKTKQGKIRGRGDVQRLVELGKQEPVRVWIKR